MQLSCFLGLIKFFGNIAYVRPKDICGKYKLFLAALDTCLQSTDQTLKGIAVDVLGLISSTGDGKLALANQGKSKTINH